MREGTHALVTQRDGSTTRTGSLEYYAYMTLPAGLWREPVTIETWPQEILTTETVTLYYAEHFGTILSC